MPPSQGLVKREYYIYRDFETKFNKRPPWLNWSARLTLRHSLENIGSSPTGGYTYFFSLQGCLSCNGSVGSKESFRSLPPFLDFLIIAKSYHTAVNLLT